MTWTSGPQPLDDVDVEQRLACRSAFLRRVQFTGCSGSLAVA